MPANGRVVLDTSVIIGHLRGRADWTSKLEEIDTAYVPLAVFGELLFGAYRSRNPAHSTQQIRDFMQMAVILLPQKRTAECYGRIKADLASAGAPIPENDIWVAASAVEHNLPVATADQHFRHITGLTIAPW